MAPPRCSARPAPRSYVLGMVLLAAWVASLAAASSNDTQSRSSAPLAEIVGIKCASRTDCGFLPGLACLDGVCEYCQSDLDCSVGGSTLRRCLPVWVQNASTSEMQIAVGRASNGEEALAAYCVEKDLFEPFTTNDIVTSVLAFLSTALGSGCGVGGGGLLVPAFILVIGLSPKHAIPLSKATIFGNAVAIYLFNFRRKHPLKPSVPIINYSIASIMEPTTLIGSIFGVMMNHIFPNWLILVLLISLLSYITKRTFAKGNKIRAKETARNRKLIESVFKGSMSGIEGRGRAWSIYPRFDWKIAAMKWLAVTRHKKQLRAIRCQDDDDFSSLPPVEGEMALATTTLLEKEHTQYKSRSQFVSDDSPVVAIRQSLERQDTNIFPIRVILPLCVAWLVVLLQALLRGGHGAPSIAGVACNSTEYWFLTVLPLSVLGIITWRVGYRLRLENRLRVLSGYEFLDSDIHWTWPRVTRFPIYCISAGVAAGLLGIGGGMVKGPIMLEMGVLPQIQTATASYMILYTASSTTLQFAIAGQFPGSKQYDYVAWFAFIGFLGGFFGQVVVAYLVKKYKRESIVVYILAGTIGLSTIAMGYIGIENTVHDIRKGVHLGFSSLCGSE